MIGIPSAQLAPASRTTSPTPEVLATPPLMGLTPTLSFADGEDDVIPESEAEDTIASISTSSVSTSGVSSVSAFLDAFKAEGSPSWKQQYNEFRVYLFL
jgi:hypothetical protein